VLVTQEHTGALAGPPPVRPIIWCRDTDLIRDAARQIGAGGHSCALVRTGNGLGIITDHDFRRRVGTGELSVDAQVSALATAPVLTIDDRASAAAALLRMLEHAVHHLVVTDRADQPIGVVRAVDLAQAEVRDPLLVRSAIGGAATLEDLARAARQLPATIVELHARRVPSLHLGAVHAALIDAIMRQVLRLEPPELGGLRQSWVVLGSLARREPLPLSDVDTALVWEDPPDRPGGPADHSPSPEAIRAAAGRVLDHLRDCGLVPCLNGTSADTPTFSRSRSAWRAAIREWQDDPVQTRALMMSAMVTDSRPVTEPELGGTLTDSVDPATRTHNTRFLRALLDEALGFHPPTGFVRDFVVEHTGEHRGQLDLKRGGLAPVAALARWVAIVTSTAGGTTPERLRRGAERGLLTADEAQTLAGAFEDIYALVLDREVAALRAGAAASTFIAPAELDTLTRRHLRETFRVVRAIQARLNEHWLARLEVAARADQ
jgi:CBS domain-containing protein